MATPPMPPPKFATTRNPDRPTRGPRQAAFGRIWLGNAFMPHQSYIADVAGELLPSGLPAYPLVVVTLQRQGGKSHMSLSRQGERAFSQPGFRGWYTAQTGSDARDQFLKFGEQVESAPLGKLVRTLVGNGREVMKFPNGSAIRPHPPTEKALHGKQSDDNDIDEGWAFPREHGQQLLQAIAPTQLTRRGAQTWIWSAGGTVESTWLAELVARGREGDPTIAYFEWGIPDDADAEDLDVIARHHPAYGHTITREALESMRAQFGDDAAGWARAAGNRWTEVIGGAIGAQAWKAVRHPDPIPAQAPIAYGAARAADGSHTVIAAAAEVDGLVVVEILDVVPSWSAAAQVAGWATDGPVAVLPDGPSATLYDDLAADDPARPARKLHRVQLLKVSSRDYQAACGRVLDALEPRSIRYREHPALDAAVQVAGKRGVSDGGFVWARLTAGAPVAALEAATLAVQALARRPARVGKPRIITAA